MSVKILKSIKILIKIQQFFTSQYFLLLENVTMTYYYLYFVNWSFKISKLTGNGKEYTEPDNILVDIKRKFPWIVLTDSIKQF